MMYRIDFSSVAKAEADAAFLSFSQFTAADRSQAWYQGLIRAIVSLQEMPRRCPIARENNFFSEFIQFEVSSSIGLSALICSKPSSIADCPKGSRV